MNTVDTTLLVLQSIVAVSLIAMILVQSKGKGFNRSIGGPSSFTRRGLEKIVFRATFVLTGVFIVISILQLAI